MIRGLYTIADNRWNPLLSLEMLAERYLKGGAKIIQLRMKDLSSDIPEDRKTLISTAHDILRLKQKYTFTFIVNDHIDIALEIGADGVHIGANDISVSEARKVLPENMLIGYSSHSASEALQAAHDGADYVALGAVFKTATKGPGHPVQGLDVLREVVRLSPVPVVAIGGINRQNIDDVLKTEVASVAMITALCRAKSIEDEVRWYVNRMGY